MSARSRDFFIMSLAHALGMTRRQLLKQTDSYELTMWEAYFREINKPPEPERQSPTQIAESLKMALTAKKAKKKHA